MRAVLLGLLRCEAHRRPQLCGAASETKRWRHHADDVIALAVERDCPIQYLRIAAKAPLPQAMTENHHEVVSGLIFFRQKTATEHRLRAQHGQEAIGDALAL